MGEMFRFACPGGPMEWPPASARRPWPAQIATLPADLELVDVYGDESLVLVYRAPGISPADIVALVAASLEREHKSDDMTPIRERRLMAIIADATDTAAVSVGEPAAGLAVGQALVGKDR